MNQPAQYNVCVVLHYDKGYEKGRTFCAAFPVPEKNLGIQENVEYT